MDIITYIEDLEAFREECAAKAEQGNEFFTIEEKPKEETEEDILFDELEPVEVSKFDGYEITYNVSKIPVVYSDNYEQSVCLIRLTTPQELAEFEDLESCVAIGECVGGEYIFYDGGQEIYNEVYDQTPIEYEEDGETFTFTKPEIIGVFL